MATNSSSHSPRTVEEIFKDFSARHAAVLRALTTDVEDFYSQCDPERDNLCLYGHPNESWEVAVPAEEVPPELPEPVLGINFARDGMERRDWLSLVAMHTDSWLLSVAFYFGARLNRNESTSMTARQYGYDSKKRGGHLGWSRVFTLINDLPTVFEAVTGRKPLKDKPSVDSGKKSKNNAKREKQMKANQRLQEESDDEDEGNEDEHEETLCGSCGTNGNEDEFWIGCDICEKWYHGKCVKITPAKAQSIKEYRCPSCSNKRAKHMA